MKDTAAANNNQAQPGGLVSPSGTDTDMTLDHEKRHDLERALPPSDEEEQQQQQQQPPPTRDMTPLRFFTVLASIYVTCLIYGLDTTIAADIQGPIVESLGHVDQLTWVGAGFPLGNVVFILLLGRLYALFDLKWTYLASVLVFEAGSAVCGAAPSMNAMIVGRVITGAGGAGIYMGCLNYVAGLTTEKERGLLISLIGGFWGLGAVLGPVIGGAFAASGATWRWAFYINLPIGGITGLLFIFLLPSLRFTQDGSSVAARLRKIDYAGFVLGAGTWVTFLLVLTQAGGPWPWNDGRTIATFVVFGAVLALYVLQQYFAVLTTPEDRLFPGHLLLLHRTQVLLYVVTAAGITTLFVVVYYVPIYFQFVNGDGPVMAAVRLLPFIVLAVAANVSAGAFLHLIKMYMVLYVLAGAFIVAGGGPIMVYLTPASSTGLIYGLTVIIAVGAGLSMSTSYTIASLTLEPKNVGAGLALQNVAQIGGQVIALAVAGQIYQSTGVRNLSAVLAGHGYSAEQIAGAVAGAQSELFQELSGELRDKAVDAITQAMQMTFVLVPVSGAVMLIAALCMKRERLFMK